jgi:hypothetical protein
LSLKFSKIDPLSFSDHASLSPDDVCYHLGEYTARRGYSYSAMNQLVLNLKKKPDCSSNELRHKRIAINAVASDANRPRRHETPEWFLAVPLQCPVNLEAARGREQALGRKEGLVVLRAQYALRRLIGGPDVNAPSFGLRETHAFPFFRSR